MSWSVTLGIGAAALALAVVAAWRGARPPDPNRPPRLVPWRMIMALAAAAVLFMLVHLLNLAGLATGRR